MTKEEFIAAYAERAGARWENMKKWKVALPCACGAPNCEGWAMVVNDPGMIADHMLLYAPNIEEKT